MPSRPPRPMLSAWLSALREDSNLTAHEAPSTITYLITNIHTYVERTGKEGGGYDSFTHSLSPALIQETRHSLLFSLLSTLPATEKPRATRRWGMRYAASAGIPCPMPSLTQLPCPAPPPPSRPTNRHIKTKRLGTYPANLVEEELGSVGRAA